MKTAFVPYADGVRWRVRHGAKEGLVRGEPLYQVFDSLSSRHIDAEASLATLLANIPENEIKSLERNIPLFKTEVK